MSLYEKIRKMDPRYLWLLLFIVYAIPILNPFGIPIPIEKGPKEIYNKISQMGEGDIILYDISGGLSNYAETEPGNTAVIKHIFNIDAKIIFFTTVFQGDAFYRIVMDSVKPEENFGYKYGVDYCFLGYIAGEETAQVSMMKNIPNTAPFDYLGEKIENIPLMEDINTVDDVDLLISMYTGAIPSRIRSYSVSGKQTGDRAWIAITTAGNVPAVLPYVDSKDVFEVLGGSVQGSEYEILTGFIGNGAKMTDTISMTQLFVILLVITTNFIYFAEKRSVK